MSVSNKTLAVMLLAAIVVSLGGTFISLNKLGAISTTGHSTADGTVQLNIATNLEITTDNSGINFGECVLGDNAAGFTINSETPGGNANGNCSTYSVEDGITVRNSGNVNALVVFNVDKIGSAQSGTFLNTGSTNSSIAYKLVNEGATVVAGTFGAGCNSGLGATSYTIFTNTSDHAVCGNLTTGANSIMKSHYQIVVPTAVASGDSVLITFTASDADA